MCPEPKRQQGSALVVAVFIIVVMSLLVAGMAALLGRQSGTVVYEVLGSRAFLAAQTGLQEGLVKLFPLDQAPQACFAHYSQPLKGSGLEGCSFTLSCQEQGSSDSSLPGKVAQLTSTGSCQAGTVSTSRTLVMEVGE
ncbi:type II secretory pathway component [Gallaecimonas kandeliae]|uniref:type II secretory pathway component n=1 Tax=Gallaecimonas kandeliae TaxID=3029055 RepID=UPI0026497E00|nr:type II secretory pathway component [Gallaecimonas kandeliae]WKE66026.1 type II secretory pathway component [Gallaecimonas kandeliae]